MQRIVPQSVPLSYSLLPAPPPLLMLAAPRFAGFLPAPQVVSQQITVEKVKFRSEARVFRSFAEWKSADEELTALFENAYRRLDAVRREVRYV
jgi:hypothetical protein